MRARLTPVSVILILAGFAIAVAGIAGPPAGPTLLWYIIGAVLLLAGFVIFTLDSLPTGSGDP